ncbi:CoA pyrophosphatase [Vibrio sp. NTOU-M3]|uniref:CoA pyrophosphatase n=1 Tax=unclassified Vibrio TaxID=2614977 RepID=UPI00349FC3C8
MLSELKKDHVIQKFLFFTPSEYHGEALKRVAHLNSDSLRKASVLIGFVERPSGLHIIFTRRAKHLKHHPGQISFPGGKYELSDSSLAHTALRETYEEIGIAERHIDILGNMKELVTISRFSVTPFIAFVSPDYKTLIDTNEVDEVFEVPASVILDKDKLKSHTFQLNNHSHRVFGLSYHQHFIWGMTAQIIQAMQNHISLS